MESYLFLENILELILVFRILLGDGDELQIHTPFIASRKGGFRARRWHLSLFVKVFSNQGDLEIIC